MHPTTAPSSPPVKNVPLLISREYAWLWSGQAISLLGDTVFQTTAVLWVATRLSVGLSWSPLAVACIFLAGEATEFLVGPLAGVFVDRWDKRRTMLAMDAARAGLLGLLILGAGSAFPSLLPFTPPRGALLGLLYSTVALITAAGQFFLPARLVLIGDIVPDQHRERASGLAQTSGAVTGILGPSLAAPLFFAFGAGWALCLDGLSFLVSFAAIWLVKSPALTGSVASRENGHVVSELMEGVRLTLSNEVLKTLLVAGVLISVGFGALDTLAIFFLRQNLHAPAFLFGLLGGAQGAGALAGAVLGGPMAERVGVTRLLWRMAALLGLLLLLFSRLTSFAPALVTLFLVGVTFAVMEVSETPLLLRATPRAHLGRVTALLIPAYGLANAASSLLAGWLASTLLRGFHLSLPGLSLGPLDTILGLASLLVIAAGLYARVNIGGLPSRSGATARDA